jgi:type IV secretory pathway TrbD component
MPDESDQDFALHTELGHEAKRLVAHPIKEIERLEHEAAEGEADTTLAILIGVLAVVLTLVVAFVLAVGYGAGWLFGSLTVA